MSETDAKAFADELWAIIGEELVHIAERNRFMGALFAGTLRREQMRLWAKQLYLLTRTGPRFLSAIHSNCEDFEAASWLVQNLYEEYGEGEAGRDHPSLCRNFGKALGMTPAELEAGPILDCTRRFIGYAFEVTRTKSYIEALAAIGVALEGVSARGAPMVGQALREHYKFSDRDVEFFTAHSEMDIEHSDRTLALVIRHATTEDMRERVRRAVRGMTEQTIEWSVTVGELCLEGEATAAGASAAS
jgi:pyrroloquinoline-quinone synthase